MHIFTYGSLMYRAVWQRVVAGDYIAVPARVHGYERRRISGETYPGLVRATPEVAVDGILYRDVSGADVAALDHFEGEGMAYTRIRVPVELSDGALVDAWTYLFLRAALLEECPWEPARFEAEGLERFLATYCRERAPR